LDGKESDELDEKFRLQRKALGSGTLAITAVASARADAGIGI
jgi:hypothetical protein